MHNYTKTNLIQTCYFVLVLYKNMNIAVTLQLLNQTGLK